MELDLLGVILLMTGCFVSWNTGANDAANCIGASVGAGILPFKKAVVLMAIFVILGVSIQGRHVMKTIGEGIVITTSTEQQDVGGPTEEDFKRFFPEERLPDLAILTALLSAGISVLCATYFGLPLSTSQSIVGGVAGAGIGIVGFQSHFFRFSVLSRIFGSWVISPFLTLIVAFLLYQLLVNFSRRVKNIYRWEKNLARFVILSSCYFSYSLGANAFGSELGPLLIRFPNRELFLAFLCGAALAFGAWTFGQRVTETVGKNITQLDFAGAFAAQFAAGFGLQIFSLMGIPVSSSQSIVGAVFGVGLVKGARMVNNKKIYSICLGWVLAPAFAGSVSALLYRILHYFLG